MAVLDVISMLEVLFPSCHSSHSSWNNGYGRQCDKKNENRDSNDGVAGCSSTTCGRRLISRAAAVSCITEDVFLLVDTYDVALDDDDDDDDDDGDVSRRLPACLSNNILNIQSCSRFDYRYAYCYWWSRILSMCAYVHMFVDAGIHEWNTYVYLWLEKENYGCRIGATAAAAAAAAVLATFNTDCQKEHWLASKKNNDFFFFFCCINLCTFDSFR